MQMPGPSRTDRRSARHSLPRTSPNALVPSLSHALATAAADGKQMAVMVPRPFIFRRPVGPSETMTDGTANRSTEAVCQKSLPVRKLICSRSVIFFTLSSNSISIPPILLRGILHIHINYTHGAGAFQQNARILPPKNPAKKLFPARPFPVASLLSFGGPLC